jgi:hypothetical protein
MSAVVWFGTKILPDYFLADEPSVSSIVLCEERIAAFALPIGNDDLGVDEFCLMTRFVGLRMPRYGASAAAE